ncbi:MAG: hypothetical protein R6X27_04305 [Candidatus Desulfacyla sp.]
MLKKLAMAFLLVGLISFGTPLCVRADTAKSIPGNDIFQASTALFGAHKEMDLKKSDERLLTLTNAGYGTLKGQSTEVFLDIISDTTGCTMGKKNLLMIHTPFMESLWFAPYRKDNGKLIFAKWQAFLCMFKTCRIQPPIKSIKS